VAGFVFPTAHFYRCAQFFFLPPSCHLVCPLGSLFMDRAVLVEDTGLLAVLCVVFFWFFLAYLRAANRKAVAVFLITVLLGLYLVRVGYKRQHPVLPFIRPLRCPNPSMGSLHLPCTFLYPLSFSLDTHGVWLILNRNAGAILFNLAASPISTVCYTLPLFPDPRLLIKPLFFYLSFEFLSFLSWLFLFFSIRGPFRQ